LYSYGKGDEYYPATAFNFVADMEGGVSAAGIKVPSIDISHPMADCGDTGTQDNSLIAIFFLGLLGGLIALLTPCVFPMVPVTVTFFTKKSTSRRLGVANAVLYGFFIFLIYILITIPFHVAGKAISPEIFNNISTNVWLNLLFFTVFVVFALSFFGLFEIGLPSGLANRMDSRSSLGNIGGIFFMAATLAIVSFSCTGPILGTLLVGVADQGAWPLTIGAAGFGIALGLPFALFAMFPNWLQSLPKSGGWMTDVKVVLGFLELALAIKFLSNADLVKQWGLLKREVFIGLWVVIGALTTLYLLGVLRFPHSSRVRKFSFSRVCFIILFGAITLYLVPGLTNTRAGDLTLISGFPPPRSYSFYDIGKGKSRIYQPLHNEYLKALQLAKEQHKPVLIDFTGWACVNCRRMEEKVWTNKTVDSLFRNEFIVVSLYVDEKKNLPLAEQTEEKLTNGTTKSIVTVGDKWATFQIENFGATSQPQYAIISPDQVALTRTKFYTPNAKEFVRWLRCGLEAYKK
jgi:thiol:disulfide interchange protein DsbD